MMAQIDKLQEAHKAIAEEIIKMLEKGTAPWQCPWGMNGTDGFLPINAVTGNRYRGGNAIYLLSLQVNKGYQDPRWFTFKQANDLGARINKGEKGALVEYWQFSVKEKDEKGNEVELALKKPRVFRAVVFNAEQISGLKPFEKPVFNWKSEERAEKILTAADVEIQTDYTSRGAYYSPTADVVKLPPKEAFKTKEDYYATALHEIGHSTGHSSRLSRDMSAFFGTPEYAREELRAEIVSMFLCRDLSISNLQMDEQHAAYVDSWIKALRKDPNEIFRAAADSEKICDYLYSQERKLNLLVDKVKENIPVEELERRLEQIRTFEDKPYKKSAYDEYYRTAKKQLGDENFAFKIRDSRVAEVLFAAGFTSETIQKVISKCSPMATPEMTQNIVKSLLQKFERTFELER